MKYSRTALLAALTKRFVMTFARMSHIPKEPPRNHRPANSRNVRVSTIRGNAYFSMFSPAPRNREKLQGYAGSETVDQEVGDSSPPSCTNRFVFRTDMPCRLCAL